MTATPALTTARAEVLARIADAAARAGRDASEVDVVAVTKTVPANRIREAVAVGFLTLAENRVQERAAKVAELDATSTWPAGEAPRWHLVGPLQSNKARRAVELFDVIETVDSIDLARRLDRIVAEVRPGRPLSVLLQVNVDDDEAKAGYAPAAVDGDLAALLELPNLSVDGLMTVGRLVETAADARPTFVALRRLSERLRARDGRLGGALSMGMSEDFEVAVEEGATLVRLGRVVFGARAPVG
jgi:pyridoxal phosphate enzyme (YggS family)